MHSALLCRVARRGKSSAVKRRFSCCRVAGTTYATATATAETTETTAYREMVGWYCRANEGPAKRAQAVAV